MTEQISTLLFNLSRRDFMAGVSAGLAGGLILPKYAQGESPAESSLKRLLYVTNDPERKVDIFDIPSGHQLVRSFPMSGGKVGGICAHAGTGRLFISQQSEDSITAYDLLTDKIIWKVLCKDTFGCKRPDRISVTLDGKALYSPMKSGEVVLVLDAATGEKITLLDRPGRPHNSWCGESGKYMYVAGRSHPVMYLIDQQSHRLAKEIGPFSWPIRPFSVDREERFFYANLTYTHGFGVGDIETGKVNEVRHLPPWERLQHWDDANGGLPHGDHPFSHGIAIRPSAQEVWHLDDQWGYLNVFDTSQDPFQPKFKHSVELFDAFDEPWDLEGHNRWVAFSLDGSYCYPSEGSVVDAAAGKKTSMRISPSEKLIEIQFQGNQVARVGGQMGGVYG